MEIIKLPKEILEPPQNENKPQNKFVKLNFNLKKEIIYFLPFTDQMRSVLFLNKSFLLPMQSNILFQNFALKNMEDYLHLKTKYNYLAIMEKCFSILRKLRNPIFSHFNKYVLSSHIVTYQFEKFRKNDLGKISFHYNDFCLEDFDILKQDEKTQFLALNQMYLADYPEYFDEFCLMLSENKAIQKIYMYENNLGIISDNVEKFCEALQENQSLINLSLSDNYLGEHYENLNFLADALDVNSTLKYLNLSQNILCTEKSNSAFVRLIEQLYENSTLEHLDLSENNIGYHNENGECLKEFLSQNNALRVLVLNDNYLASSPCILKKICTGLCNNNDLQELYLSGNQIFNKNHLNYFKDALVENLSLKFIQFGNRYDYKEEFIQFVEGVFSYEISLEVIAAGHQLFKNKREAEDEIYIGALSSINDIEVIYLNELNNEVND